MLQRLRTRLSAYLTPDREISPYESYQLRMLWSVVMTMFVVLLALGAYAVVDVVAWEELTLLLIVLLLGWQFVILWLGRQGRLQLAARLEISTVWLFIFYGSYLSGGIYASVVMLQFIPIILAVILLGPRSGLWLLFVTLLSFVALLVIELTGNLPDAPVQVLTYRMLILFIMFPTVYNLFSLHIRQMREMENRNIVLSSTAERMKVQQELARHVAHDLRTPLSVLNTQLYLLRTRHDRGLPIDDSLAQVETYVQKLINMTEDFSQLTMLAHEGDTEVPEWRFIDLPALLRNTVSDIVDYGNTRAIRIELVESCEMPCWVFGEPYFLAQVFSHLVNNAIHYGRDGGYVRVEVSHTDTDAIVTVTDDGIGIPQDMQERIFEPFFRASEARTMDERIGSGMGLAIAQRMVRLHQGSISVESSPDSVTTFTVTLPLRR